MGIMEVNGISIDQFRACVRDISHVAYAGNVITAGSSMMLASRKSGQQRCRARLTVGDSRGPGSRTSWTGRHGPYACWHAYRDVLSLAFRRFPDAVIRSGNTWRVTYRGADGFAELYPETAGVNVGSWHSPVTMPELCECSSEIIAPTMPHRGARPPQACLCAACNALREARQQSAIREGFLTCGTCGVSAGLFSSSRTLDAHARLQHGEGAGLSAAEARRAAVLETARKQQDKSEALLTDPVFGPRLVPGNHFGY